MFWLTSAALAAAPRVDLVIMDTEGELDQDRLTAAVESAPVPKLCFDDATDKGHLTLSLTLEPDGARLERKENTIENAVLAGCIEAYLARVEWPASTASTTSTIELRLNHAMFNTAGGLGLTAAVNNDTNEVVKTDATIEGPLDPAELEAVVKAQFWPMDRCTGSKHRYGELRGKHVVSFSVSAEGEVSGVETVSSQWADPEAEACVNAVFAAMEFHPPAGGSAKVEYPVQVGEPIPEEAPAEALDEEQGPPPPQLKGLSFADAVGGLGGAELAHIQAHLAEVQPEVDACYAQAHVDTPALAGVLQAKFMITPDGTVPHVVRHSSTLQDDGPEACVFAAIQGAVFPDLPAHPFLVLWTLELGR